MTPNVRPELIPIDDLARPRFIRQLAAKATGSKPPDPRKVRQLGPKLQELARSYRPFVEEEARGMLVHEQRERLEKIRDLSVELDAQLNAGPDLKLDELAKFDEDEIWLRRASDRINAFKRRRPSLPSTDIGFARFLLRRIKRHHKPANKPIAPPDPADIRKGQKFFLCWPYHPLDECRLFCVKRGKRRRITGEIKDTVTFMVGKKRMHIDAESCWSERPHRDKQPPRASAHPPLTDAAVGGVDRMEKIKRAVSELPTITRVAVKMIAATPAARGGPSVSANVAQMRLDASGEIGCVYQWLTSEKPKRQVRTIPRKGVKGGKQSVEAGRWHAFLTAMLEAIFGTSKGVDRYALEVARGMDKNPERYWTSIIHTQNQ